jgi:hypothetical protein
MIIVIIMPTMKKEHHHHGHDRAEHDAHGDYRTPALLRPNCRNELAANSLQLVNRCAV